MKRHREKAGSAPPVLTAQPFWKQKKLHRMTRKEWESLCDGCGKCCLFKLENGKTGEVRYTDVSCLLLDLNTCRCKDYKKRNLLVPTCAVLTPERAAEFHWLPDTCAYRLLSKGKNLPPWHHLVCGDRQAIHRRGHSIKGKAISEKYISLGHLEKFVTDWKKDSKKTGNKK